MAKKNIVYHEKIHGEETLIYFIEDEYTGRKKYYVLEAVPQQYQENRKYLDKIYAEIEKYNAEKNKSVKLTALTTKTGEKRWFVEEPSSLIGALYRAHEVDKEIKLEQKAIEVANKAPSGMVASGNKFKKASNNAKTKAIAIGLAATMFVGSLVGITALSNRGNDVTNDKNYTVSGEVTEPSYNNDWTTEPSFSQTSETTETPEVEDKYVDIDLNTFKYETYLNSAGVRMIETEDAFKIAETCYNVMVQALEDYNKSVPEDKRYSYDPTDFDSSHMMARWTRESSLIIDVDPQNNENVKNAGDYQKQCRGPFKMSADAINEANAIAVKLFGEKIIKSEEDIYNPIKQCMASYLFNVQANEYFNSYGVEDVKCNQLGASYLFGVWGTVRDKRENSSYAKDIEYYSDCFGEYKDAILSSKLSESEKEQVVKNLTLKLWAKPNWSEVESQGVEPGE